MIINIEDKEYEYDPAFSSTNKVWSKRLSWYTTVPQVVGPYNCFVKRFEARPYGWDLIEQLIGIPDTGFPKVLAALKVVEGGQEIHYLIQEFLPGLTLKSCLKEGVEFNGTRLMEDLWKGLETLNKYEFWHGDFNEENIFYVSEKGTFLIIDIDSTYSKSIAPSRESNSLGGIINQEGAIAALKFIQKNVDSSIKSFQSFGGSLLNELQLVFILTKLHFLIVGEEPFHRSKLPNHLNDSGNLAIRYISSAWKHREKSRVISLPVLKTLLGHQFPELKKRVLIQLNKNSKAKKKTK